MHDRGIICLNGHKLGQKDDPKAKHCSHCGERNIAKCPKCGEVIYEFSHDEKNPNPMLGGSPYVPGPARSDWREPNYCSKCGQDFTWTERRISALQEMIQAFETLQPAEQEGLIDSLNGLTSIAPNSELAVLRFKKAIVKLDPDQRDGIFNVLSAIVTPAVMKSLGLEHLS